MPKFDINNTLLVMDWDRTISRYDSSSYALLKNFVIEEHQTQFLAEMNQLTDRFFESEQTNREAFLYYKNSFDLIRKYNINNKINDKYFSKFDFLKEGAETILNSNYSKIIYSAGIKEVIDGILSNISTKNIIEIHSNTINSKQGEVVTHLDKTGRHLNSDRLQAFSRFIVVGDTPSDCNLLTETKIPDDQIVTVGIWNKEGHHTKGEMEESFDYVFGSKDDLYELNRFIGI